MASKFGLAGGIPERRVRQIWDSVDSRQFRHALKLSVALLAKYPNSPYALALKALILERMGKPDEALGVCLEAKELLFSHNVTPIDDLTLSTLQIVFQRLDRLDLATSCYEHACVKFPNNLEIIMGLFNCYVREYSFVKQQQTAIKMYKIVGEERFLLWAVCSIQLQVFCSSGDEKLLALADALLKKHISLHGLHEPEALVIYISVLEQQAKYRDALEILSGDLGSLIGIAADKLRMQGRLLARACDYAAAADIFQKVLESCPDDWEAFLHYLGCLLEKDMNWPTAETKQIFSPKFVDFQACKGAQLTEETFDERMSTALSFVQKLQMEVDTDYVRCPYLSTIEIERQRRLKGKPNDGKLLEALLDYFHRFGHLSCFTSDVEVFLHTLTDYEKADILDKFEKSSESPLASPLKTLGRAITLFKVQELLGVNMTLRVVELENAAIRMVEMYYKNLPLSRDLDPQENMHGEELLSMASSVLVMLFWRTKHLGYLLEAILVLEFGLTIRKYVWQYKIPLLHLYSYFGALPLAYEWYGTLDVKNILLETVLHHIVPQMLRSPFLSETTELLREYLKFMDDHFREAADLTFLAYRHRNYSKVIEFVQFKDRLQHSNQYLMARIEASVLQLKQKADNIEEVECILENLNYGTQLLELSNEKKLKSLTFNEDLQARPWWSPSPDVNYLSEPFEGECLRQRGNLPKLDKEEGTTRKLIERRSFIPRLVYLSTQTTSSLKEIIDANGSTLDTSSSQELKQLLERYARNIGFSFDDAITFILEITKGQKSSKDFGSDVVDWVNFAIFLNAWNTRSQCSVLFSGDRCNPSSWGMVDSLVKTCVSDQLTCAQLEITNPQSNFPVLVQLVTECFSWHLLVIQSCVRSMVPQGKKKKKSSATDQPNLSQVQAIHASVECLIKSIHEVCSWMERQVSVPEDQNLDALLSLVHKNEHEEGPGHVLQILEDNASANNSELGERISGALQSWNSADVLRKVVRAQSSLLSKFRLICDSKLKLLETLKQSI